MKRVARDCWDKLDLLWSTPYLFTKAELAGLPRSASGPFYRQSSGLRRRFGEHLRSRCPVVGVLPKLLTTYVTLGRVDDDALRLAVEAALILRNALLATNAWRPNLRRSV